MALASRLGRINALITFCERCEPFPDVLKRGSLLRLRAQTPRRKVLHQSN